MGRNPIFNLKSLKIGQKLPFPASKKKYIYQYLNNFNRGDGPEQYEKVETEGKFFIRRVA